jgi:hypothetical protein
MLGYEDLIDTVVASFAEMQRKGVSVPLQLTRRSDSMIGLVTGIERLDERCILVKGKCTEAASKAYDMAPCISRPCTMYDGSTLPAAITYIFTTMEGPPVRDATLAEVDSLLAAHGLRLPKLVPRRFATDERLVLQFKHGVTRQSDGSMKDNAQIASELVEHIRSGDFDIILSDNFSLTVLSREQANTLKAREIIAAVSEGRDVPLPRVGESVEWKCTPADWGIPNLPPLTQIEIVARGADADIQGIIGADAADQERFRVKWLGTKGLIKTLMNLVGSVEPEQKDLYLSKFGELKEKMEAAYANANVATNADIDKMRDQLKGTAAAALKMMAMSGCAADEPPATVGGPGTRGVLTYTASDIRELRPGWTDEQVQACVGMPIAGGLPKA